MDRILEQYFASLSQGRVRFEILQVSLVNGALLFRDMIQGKQWIDTPRSTSEILENNLRI